MDRLWIWNTTATVRDVVEDLQRDRTVASTTVMTVMDNLHTKGWLTRERPSPTVSWPRSWPTNAPTCTNTIT